MIAGTRRLRSHIAHEKGLPYHHPRVSRGQPVVHSCGFMVAGKSGRYGHGARGAAYLPPSNLKLLCQWLAMAVGGTVAVAMGIMHEEGLPYQGARIWRGGKSVVAVAVAATVVVARCGFGVRGVPACLSLMVCLLYVLLYLYYVRHACLRVGVFGWVGGISIVSVNDVAQMHRLVNGIAQ